MELKSKAVVLLFFGILLVSFVNAENFLVSYQNGTLINESTVINQTRLSLKSSNNHTLGFILYSVSRGIPRNFNRLCSPCSETSNYSKSLILGEGVNNINIKDSDNQNLSINITVDTKKPIIKNILNIINNRYSNGIINITFIEKSIPNVSLSYKEPSSLDYNITEVSNCNKIALDTWNCQADLSDQNGKTLNFFFNVSDKFYTVGSRNFTVTVDTIGPIINIYSPLNNSQFLFGQPIFFSIGISEPSQISYDVNFNGRNAILCRGNCSYVERSLRLVRGNHTIRISAKDNSGNINSEIRSVSVV